MEVQFKKLAEEAHKLCSWLESHGLNVSPTRVARYTEYLDNITSNLENDTPENINEKIDEYLHALFEHAELSVIYQAFKNESPEGIEGLLHKIVSGPFSYLQESQKNTGPRNFAFEASLGARMALANIPVSFNYNGDVFSEVRGIPLFFQCKRLVSLKQVRSRISKASKQLRKDYSAHKSKISYGFIALDITKLVNPGAVTMLADSAQEVEAQNSEFRQAFIDEYVQDLKVSHHKRTIGIVVRSAYLCFNKQAGSYSFNQGYTIAELAGITSAQKIVFDIFHEEIMSNVKARRF